MENTANCCLVLGDLNLNPQIEIDNNKLIRLCKQDKYLALSEITTNQFRQLDHVIALKTLEKKLYATSYYNFVSDHKTIGVRLSVHDTNPFCQHFLENLSFSFQNYSFSRKRPHEKIDKKALEKKMRKCTIKSESEDEELIEVNEKPLSSDRKSDETSSNIDSLKNFEDTCWLNDININDYSILLERHFKGKIFVFSSYFYGSLLEKGYDHVKRWMKNVDIFDMRFVFYPMFENSHWFLGIQNNLTNKLQLLDPYDPSYKIVLSSKNSMYSKDIEKIKNDRLKEIIHKHKQRLENIVNLFLKMHERYHEFQIEVLVPPSIPKQTNDNDCGVFLLEFMKFTTFEKQFTFTCDNMPNFRQELMKEMTNNTILPITQTGHPIFREVSTSKTKQPTKRQSSDISSGHAQYEGYEMKKKKVEVVSDFTVNDNKQELHRRIVNKDSTSCWLNSCLQTLLVALDSCENCPQFNSELGNQLLTMHSISTNGVNLIWIGKSYIGKQCDSSPESLFYKSSNKGIRM